MNPVRYNITFNIEQSFFEEWSNWVDQYFIRAHMSTKIFTAYSINRLIGGDQRDGVNYAIQFVCDSLGSFQKFATTFHTDIEKNMRSTCGEKAVSYASLMEVIEYKNIKQS